MAFNRFILAVVASFALTGCFALTLSYETKDGERVAVGFEKKEMPHTLPKAGTGYNK